MVADVYRLVGRVSQLEMLGDIHGIYLFFMLSGDPKNGRYSEVGSPSNKSGHVSDPGGIPQLGVENTYTPLILHTYTHPLYPPLPSLPSTHT